MSSSFEAKIAKRTIWRHLSMNIFSAGIFIRTTSRSCAHGTIASGNSTELCGPSGGKERQVALRPKSSSTYFLNLERDDHSISCWKEFVGAVDITSGPMLAKLNSLPSIASKDGNAALYLSYWKKRCRWSGPSMFI